MAVGLAAAVANGFLDNFRNNAVSARTVYMKLHTDVGDPGAAGTANASAVTTRNAVTWNAASSGSMTLSSVGSYSMTSSETIKFVSFWDALTSGNFLQSAQLTTPVPVINGSTLSFSSLTLSFTPLAA